MSTHRRTKTVLPPSRAGSLDLVGGELAWDFTNTSSSRGLPAHWAHIRAARSGHPRRARHVFERALEIRELIWEIGTALAEQRPVPARLIQLALLAPPPRRKISFAACA